MTPRSNRARATAVLHPSVTRRSFLDAIRRGGTGLIITGLLPSGRMTAQEVLSKDRLIGTGGAPAGPRDAGASADVVDYPEQPLLRPLALLHAIRRRGRLETAHRWRRGAAARIDARRPESGAVQVDGRHVGVRRQRPRLLRSAGRGCAVGKGCSGYGAVDRRADGRTAAHGSYRTFGALCMAGRC